MNELYEWFQLDTDESWSSSSMSFLTGKQGADARDTFNPLA